MYIRKRNTSHGIVILIKLFGLIVLPRITISFSNVALHRKSIVLETRTFVASKDIIAELADRTDVDKLPHEQRVVRLRKARRLNHSFMHLYRHDSNLFDDTKLAPGCRALSSARIYLKEYGGYSDSELDAMSVNFPPLFDLDVRRHVQPKMRFLKYTLGGVNNALDDGNHNRRLGPKHLSQREKLIPPQYFGCRLEKVIAPRHAFLIHLGLPHGPILLRDDALLFQEFLLACRKPNLFAALCNDWKRKYGVEYADPEYMKINAKHDGKFDGIVTPKIVEAFDSLFGRGILAAARDDMDPQDRYLNHLSISCGQMVYLLIKHGSNPLETDVRGFSLLHWSAGSGRLDALVQLAQALPGGTKEALNLKAERDGATVLHWAAAGSNAKNFGFGGHLDICMYLIANCEPNFERELVSAQTNDGNSVLMWASWSGSYDIVKLMVRHRADTQVRNRNGCSVAHWASSGGSLEVCRYLHSIGVDFTEENYAGNTPLSHSVAYGRADVIQWLKHELKVEDKGLHAMDLALDFFHWDSIDDDDIRKNIADLFKIPEHVHDV